MRSAKNAAGAIWTILKDMVGKDITKYSMPVIVNEPLSNLQKTAEHLQFTYLLEEASKQESSLLRLVYVTAFAAAKFNLVSGRL